MRGDQRTIVKLGPRGIAHTKGFETLNHGYSRHPVHLAARGIAHTKGFETRGLSPRSTS